MEAYDAMAEAYDELFPPSPEFQTFMGSPRDSGRAVDLGCATGAHVDSLRALGWDASGLDPSEAMIAAARRARGAPERFSPGGMLDLGRLVPSGGAELVLCVGNTLPHLEEGELGRFLAQCARALSPAGRLVVQLLNYAKLMAERPSDLSTVRGGRWILARSYRYREDGGLDFLTRLSGPGVETVGSTRLQPFTPGQVLAEAFIAGFEAEGVYESWDRSPFDIEASPFVLMDLRRSEEPPP